MQFTNITTYLQKPPYFYVCNDFLQAINRYSELKGLIAGFLFIELQKKQNKKQLVILLNVTTHAAVDYKIVDGNYYFKLHDILLHN